MSRRRPRPQGQLPVVLILTIDYPQWEPTEESLVFDGDDRATSVDRYDVVGDDSHDRVLGRRNGRTYHRVDSTTCPTVRRMATAESVEMTLTEARLEKRIPCTCCFPLDP